MFEITLDRDYYHLNRKYADWCDENAGPWPAWHSYDIFGHITWVFETEEALNKFKEYVGLSLSEQT